MISLTEDDHRNCLLHLQNLLRINTTNPPGNELAAVLYLKNIFDALGIEYKIAEPKPNRASIVARLPGDGTQKPLLLSSHLDVVPAENEFWSADPFGGHIKDNCIWGRGAVDMKNMTAMTLMTLLKCKSEALPLKRDLIFAAVADEEAGSTFGAKWLVDHHPEWLRADYAVNEVGGFSLPLNGQIFYPIGVAEKGVCWFEIELQGLPGHGSLPHTEQALQKMGAALTTLTQKTLPFHLAHVVRDFVQALAKHHAFPKNLFLLGLKSKWLNPWILKLNPDAHAARKLWAMFHNTLAPTLVSAGEKINVIPGSGKIGIDGRILPGSSVAEFLNEVKNLLGPEIKINVLHAAEPSQITHYQTDFFHLLKSTLQKHDPGCHPIPFLIPGFSDSQHYHRLGIKSYGFAPAKLPNDMHLADLYHAHNERLPLSALRFGLHALWDVVQTWCCGG